MTTIKFRRDTSTNWTSVNPVPSQGEPCYETDTGKLKIGNGSDNYVTLPYVSDGGAANLPIASTTTLGAIKVGNNLTITEDGTLTANDSNYIKTSQVSKNGFDSGIYLNSFNGNRLTTIQPKFNNIEGALKIDNILYLKPATYSASEPADEDMTNNWTDENGYFTGIVSTTGFISGNVRFVAGSGSSQVVFKLMEAGFIAGIDQKGRHKFSKIETSMDGTTYTEYNNSNTKTKYIRFTYNYTFLDETLASFSTRIRTRTSNIAGGETVPLSVKVDNQTIQIVDDKLHANFDEINGEISDVSSRVTSLETQVGDISTTLDSNTTDIENLKETKNDNIFDISKFTVVGSPTITDDGIASGFSNSNYLTNNLPALGPRPFKIITKLNTGNAGKDRFICKLGTTAYKSVFLITSDNNLAIWSIINDGNKTDVTPIYFGVPANTDLFVKAEWDGSHYYVSISYDGKTWLDSRKRASTYPLVTYNQSGIYIGHNGVQEGSYGSGSIDLKQFSITVDGKEVFNGLMSSTKPMYDAIKANNTKLSEFKTETSTDFSAVNSALNEKANLSDLSKCASLADFNRLSATVTALESQVRDISARLNNINGG